MNDAAQQHEGEEPAAGGDLPDWPIEAILRLEEHERRVAEFLSSPLTVRMRLEGELAERGVPRDAPTLLLVLCPRCNGRLGTVRSTEHGPVFLGARLRDNNDPQLRLGRRKQVARLLARPPAGQPMADIVWVSCLGGTCQSRYALLRHELLTLANRRDTRKWRPPTTFIA